MDRSNNFQILPDIINQNLLVLFIGYNPSLRSAEVGHHYAGKNNCFWKMLFLAGLTPRQLQPDEDRSVLSYGLGLTNIVDRPTRKAEEITKQEYQQGKDLLREKLLRYSPQIACYVGKGVYQVFSGQRNILWGEQQYQVAQGVTDFVVPSTSGLNRMKFEEQLKFFRELKNLICQKKQNKKTNK